MTPLKVLFTTAEATPFAKIGGLADVSQALPQALVALGHDARVVLPLYPGVREKATDLEDVTGDTPIFVPTAHRRYACRIARATFPGSTVHAHFIDCPELYERGSIYTQDDDEHVRFVVLTRAALELCQRWQWAPDVAHAHDWHTALQPLYLKTAYAWDRLFERTRSLLTDPQSRPPGRVLVARPRRPRRSARARGCCRARTLPPDASTSSRRGSCTPTSCRP